MPALDTNATACVLGGVNIHLGGLVTPNGTSFAAVAGPDPNDTVAAGCCAPYPVHFIPPCLLWCEFGPESPRTPWTACIEAHGVTVHASMILGPPDAFRVSRPPGTPVAAIASVLAIASGLALAFAAV
ncbi:hypothetical protein MN608_05517 [Microdochium nivale]|nr:hypothetical protein MN608_05517 [Microdochium nivale]